MRRLKGVLPCLPPTVRGPGGTLPRAYRSHKTPDGCAYARYVRALQARLGPFPPAADTTLREAGRLSVELAAMGYELEAARELHRRRDVFRLRRQMVPMRTQLITLERRLEELAKAGSNGHRDPLEAVKRDVAQANRRHRTRPSAQPAKAAGGRR